MAKRQKRSKAWRRARKFNRHHIRNRCRGGSASTSNIIRMDKNRHAAWHFLFKNMDFIEVANLLRRCVAMKGAQPYVPVQEAEGDQWIS